MQTKQAECSDNAYFWSEIKKKFLKISKFSVHIQNSPIQNSPIQKSPKHQKKVLKNSPIQNSPIQNSPKPVEFHDLDLLAPTELIYAFKTQTGAIKDQRAKFGTIIWMKIKGLMV